MSIIAEHDSITLNRDFFSPTGVRLNQRRGGFCSLIKQLVIIRIILSSYHANIKQIIMINFQNLTMQISLNFLIPHNHRLDLRNKSNTLDYFVHFYFPLNTHFYIIIYKLFSYSCRIKVFFNRFSFYIFTISFFQRILNPNLSVYH